MIVHDHTMQSAWTWRVLAEKTTKDRELMSNCIIKEDEQCSHVDVFR